MRLFPLLLKRFKKVIRKGTERKRIWHCTNAGLRFLPAQVTELEAHQANPNPYSKGELIGAMAFWHTTCPLTWQPYNSMEDAMCHHLNTLGQFQSGQYLCLAPDEIVLSFRDSAEIEALHAFADLTEDDDLAVAIVKRLDAIAEENLRLAVDGAEHSHAAARLIVQGFHRFAISNVLNKELGAVLGVNGAYGWFPNGCTKPLTCVRQAMGIECRAV